MRSKVKRAIEESAANEGALRVTWSDNSKHTIAHFHMPDGRVLTMAVSQGKCGDEYKQRGWTRQFIRNAARQQFRS